jgi:hypothetical protein
MSELKACPRCGNKNVELVETEEKYSNRPSFWSGIIKCNSGVLPWDQDCDFWTPLYHNKEALLRDYNYRPIEDALRSENESLVKLLNVCHAYIFGGLRENENKYGLELLEKIQSALNGGK